MMEGEEEKRRRRRSKRELVATAPLPSASRPSVRSRPGEANRPSSSFPYR